MPQARKRPLIYVYNMPPAFTTRMLQYRLSKCAALCPCRCTLHAALEPASYLCPLGSLPLVDTLPAAGPSPPPHPPTPSRRTQCAWRAWTAAGGAANTSVVAFNGHYTIETLLHEQLLQSPHRCGAGRACPCRLAAGSRHVTS
jgi:ferredoxin-thioredoxin reductase catalytic subunit